MGAQATAGRADGGIVPFAARVVWAAALGSVATFWGMLRYIVPPGTAAAPVASLQVVLLAMAVLLTLVTLLVHRRLAGGSAASDAASATGASLVQALAPQVVCWALADAIGMLGLVAGLLTRDAGAARVLLPWAMLLLIVLRPRPAQVVAPRD